MAANNIKSFDNNTPSDVIAATLLQEGGVIVRNLVADDLIDKVNQELREPLETKGHEFENDFNGYKTRLLLVVAVVALMVRFWQTWTGTGIYMKYAKNELN
jgi:hypothetical protein